SSTHHSSGAGCQRSTPTGSARSSFCRFSPIARSSVATCSGASGRVVSLIALAPCRLPRILTGARGAVMSFKVVATPFGRSVEAAFPHESEALTPLGVTIEAVQAESDDDYVEKVRDADAIIAGGRMLSAEVIARLDKAKVIANGGVGVDR